MDPAPEKPPRLVMLPFIAVLLFGGYFAADSVAALGPLLISELGLARADIGLLYGVYSWPNVVMVLFGGMLADRIGTRKASLLYSALIVVGSALVALSPSLRSSADGSAGRSVLYCMVIGRTLLGLGAESLAVCQNAMISRWFRGHQLALAFALTLTMARIGSLLSFATEADIAARFGGVSAALWAAFWVCVLSGLGNVVYVILDRRRPDSSPPERSAATSEPGSLLARAAEFLRFGGTYYLLSAFCVCFYSAFFPFTALAADFLGEKWQLSAATAGRLCSLVTLLTVVLSPLFGGLLDRGDRKKRSDRMLLVAAILLLPAYLLLGLSHLPPLLAFVLLGCAFSLAPAALWPQIGYLVPEHRVATAYGLMVMLQSIALALVPWGSGALRDRTASYTASMFLFAGLGALSVLLALLLMRRVTPRV
ncbi:MAG: MFS transporter [Myxococcales bacterium]|nr:MFS transporter [Myxococcales bacterium]